jgi:cysteine desulfurase
VSSGSACSSNGQHHPSSALLAFGRTSEEADASLRISLSHHNTKEEIEVLIDALKRGLGSLARFKK